MIKYILTDEFIERYGRKYFRIKAVRDFGSITKETLGGYIEHEKNLSHDGNAWVSDEAIVGENALVCDNAVVSGNARIIGDAKICGNARVSDEALVDEDAVICGNALICGIARVSNNAKVYGNVRVYNSAVIENNAIICGDAKVFGGCVSDDAVVCGDVSIHHLSQILSNAEVRYNADYVVFHGFGPSSRSITAFRTKDNSVKIKCGCFLGGLDEFVAKVDSKYGDTFYGRVYKALAEVIKINFSRLKENGEKSN